MSQVLERNRSTSQLKYIETARQIRNEVTRFATSKQIPKSYRFVFATPLALTARDLVDHVNRASRQYPSTARGIIYRRHYVSLAIGDCDLIAQDIQTIRDIGIGINLNTVERLAGLIDEEITLLQGVKKNTRLTKDTPISERIEKLERELAELREIEPDYL